MTADEYLNMLLVRETVNTSTTSPVLAVQATLMPMGAIDIVPRANSNGALAKSRSPYVVHVSKSAMALYAEHLVHEYAEATQDCVFVNWWGGQVFREWAGSELLTVDSSGNSRRGPD